MNFENNFDFARHLDANDPLGMYRDAFYIPKNQNGNDTIYLCGNSLGLQPKSAKNHIDKVIDEWRNLGVQGHFDKGNPWISYHERLAERMSRIVGSKPTEVAIMNGLTVNLHLMMVSFYRPTAKRHKILIESNAFPSDQYAIKSQIEHHGFDSENSLVEIQPREGESVIRTDDILKIIEEEGEQITLIIMGGLNYYTGQLFDLKNITEVGHKKGCYVGFDLAHAVGNVSLQLHDWDVDFAVWCTYKYLNSGPGGIAGCYLHEKHILNQNLRRFAGWWGHDKETRFQMNSNFIPIKSAEGWQLSNQPILLLASLHASLEIFEKVGMDQIELKSKKMTSYLEYLINEIPNNQIQIMTPKDMYKRGSQLSIKVHNSNKLLFQAISKKGVIIDWREPDVMRVSPVPLYNSYTDVYNFVQILKNCINDTELN